jgi:hypothetical protein
MQTNTDRRKKDLLAGLAMHTGTATWFRHWTGSLVYTEGVKYLAETFGAYWLIDLVASWCPHKNLRGEDSSSGNLWSALTTPQPRRPTTATAAC